MQSIPASVKVEIVANRTTTIKASVEDVERTLALTIALVVNGDLPVSAQCVGDDHPGVTVPLALLGTAAVMYVLNYSLDNLSLMR